MPEDFPSPSAEHTNHFSERGREVLSRLGIEVEDIEQWRGKKALDIGADTGEAVEELRAHGVIAIPLDIEAPEPGAPEGYVVGNAFALPFPDETFDLVMAHANPALFDAQEGVGAFKEAVRVTRPGGEVRIGPFFSRTDGEGRDEARENLAQLQNTYPSITMSAPQPSDNGYTMHYFLIRKDETA